MRSPHPLFPRSIAAALVTCLALGARAQTPEPAPPEATAPEVRPPEEGAWHSARAAFWSDAADAEAQLAGIVASPSAPAATRRDAAHLLGRLLAQKKRPADAVAAWRGALELGTGEAPSHLLDLVRFGLAKALVDGGDTSDEPLALLAAVDKSPYSPLRPDAAFLRARQLEALGRKDDAKKAYRAILERWPEAVFARDVKVRLGALEVALGKGHKVADVLAEVQAESPGSAPGKEAGLLLASLGDGAQRAPFDGQDASARVPLAHIAFLLEERRFDLALAALAPWLVEPPADAPKAQVDAWLDALELSLQEQWENFRFDEALQTSDKLKQHKRQGLSKNRQTRLYALDGDFDKARADLKKRLRGKGYLVALGDLAFEFARYEEAYEAYEKAYGKKKAPTERMVWCLLRMGKGEKAARHWEKLGKTRGFNRNLYERYWYARALQLGSKDGEKAKAKTLFEALVEDAPLEYYGLQAWSRLQEMNGTVPATVAPPVPTVPRKNDEPIVGNPTVGWSEASLAGAFDRAARPAPLAELEPRLAAFAERWGGSVEEAKRARELIGLGDVAATIGELRVIDMDMRAARSSGAALGTRTRSDLLDNRSAPRARGGASMRETQNTRKTAAQAAAMKSGMGALRKDLREIQILLADPYGMRRSVVENGYNPTPAFLADNGTSLYPIAYPDVVRPLSEQFGLPPYYVYAIMTVESAFHPGAVSVSSAYGLVQVIPRTGENLARELGFLDFTPERLLDPPVSIYFGGYYLARLLARFHGQETLAAAAYNAGPHRVATWLMARGSIAMDMFIEDIPYDQARGYTKTVLEHIAAYRRIYHGEEHVYIRNTIDPTMGDGPNY